MTVPIKPNIRTQSLKEIEDYFKARGEPAYRGRQIYEWLWKKQAKSFSEMSNLPKKTREGMEEQFEINPVSINSVQKSSDGTIKFSFSLFDGNIIEGVLIPSRTRMTACISSQVGCNLACKFCATGMLGFKRNLFFEEMFDQVSWIAATSRSEYSLPLTHIVYMGMGEPLLNYENVLKSVERIGSDEGMGMSQQRITVSTVGIAKMIRQLGTDKVKFNLALSLHAPSDKKRSMIIPFNMQNSLEDLVDAVKYFHEQTHTRITIEYVMLKNFNDTPEDARDLAEFCRNFPVKVNLIRYNPVENSPFEDSGVLRTLAFKNILEKKNMIVNLRRSRGSDIGAACGQLANKIINAKP
jgi:23S rRNA (adenine2503-C2)-methyltransferase